MGRRRPATHETKPEGDVRAPAWDELYTLAEGQQGCFSAEQAGQHGISAQLLKKHRDTGNIERLHRGVYRFTRFPAAERTHEELVVAWLWSGRAGVFSHETALQLYQLSDALPARIHLTVPAHWAGRRVTPPPNVRLYYADLDPRDWTWMGAIPVTTPRRAILEVAQAHGDLNVIDAARSQAVQRGLVTLRELDEVVAFIGTSGGHWSVRPEAARQPDGRWLTQAVSGRARRTPSPDWRVAAEAFAEAHGAHLFENKYFPPSGTMFLVLGWPIAQQDRAPEWQALYDDATRRFDWEA